MEHLVGSLMTDAEVGRDVTDPKGCDSGSSTTTIGFLPVDEAREALERIRAHCDNGIRYYTWALKRMPSIPAQAGHVPFIENRRFAMAVVLAFVEGATDEQTATIAARDEIVPRYAKAVEEEGWEPSFGSAAPSDAQ